MFWRVSGPAAFASFSALLPLLLLFLFQSKRHQPRLPEPHLTVITKCHGLGGLYTTFISHSPAGWKSKIKVLTDSLSGGDLLPGS